MAEIKLKLTSDQIERAYAALRADAGKGDKRDDEELLEAHLMFGLRGLVEGYEQKEAELGLKKF